MPDVTALLTAMRDDLVAAGLVRKSGAAGALPPVIVEPAGGAPGPGDRFDATDPVASRETAGNLVVTLRLSGEVAASGPAARLRVAVIDVVYRSDTTGGLKAGRALDAAIRDRYVGPTTYGIGVQLPGAFLTQVSIFGGLGPVSDVDGVRTELAKYALEAVA